jgi:hypothetical protein
MTREQAKAFIWERNNENPSLHWENHSEIRKYHYELLDKIYDDFEHDIKVAVANKHETLVMYYEDKLELQDKLKAKRC